MRIDGAWKRVEAREFSSLQACVFELTGATHRRRWIDADLRELCDWTEGDRSASFVLGFSPDRPAPTEVGELFFRWDLRVAQWEEAEERIESDPRSAAFFAILRVAPANPSLASFAIPEGAGDAWAEDTFGAWQNSILRELLQTGTGETLASLRAAETKFQERWAAQLERERGEAGKRGRGWPEIGSVQVASAIDEAALRSTVDAAEAVTLDVFDTLLMRRVADPNDVFWLLGREIESAGCGPGAEAFASLREMVENAERRQWQEQGKAEDVSLDGIYAALAWQMGWDDAEREQWKEREVALERRILRPHPLGSRFLPILGAKARLILSEMYLPQESLAAMLGEHLKWSPPTLWTSGSQGLSKGSGHLYARAEAFLEISPAATLHIGDNPESDLEVPQRRGWKTFAWPKITDSRLDRPEPWRPTERLSSIALGVARAERSADESLAAQIGFELLGPIVFGWLNHLATQATIHESAQIWCLGRDAYWLEQLWRRLPESYQPQGVLRYVPTSRQLWGFAAIDEIDGDDWEFLLKAAPAMTAADFFRRVGLDPSELSLPEELSWDRVLTGRHGYFDPRDRDRLYESFVRNIEAFHRVRLERRDRVLRALEAMNPTGEAVAWIDLGWHGSSARSLAVLARQLGWDSPVGHYFATWREGQAKLDQGARFGSFFSHLGRSPARVALLREGIALLENVFCSLEPTVNDLDSAGNPVAHFPDPRTESQLTTLREIWDGARRFVDSVVELVPSPVPFQGGELVERALSCWLRHPTAAEAALFVDWPHAEGWGLDRYHPLISPIAGNAADEALLQDWERCGWRRGWIELLDRETAERVRGLL